MPRTIDVSVCTVVMGHFGDELSFNRFRLPDLGCIGLMV